MNEEFAADFITLINDEGEEHEFEILDVIENPSGRFYALIPTKEDDNSEDIEEVYYIFEEIEENGEKKLAEIEDDSLLDKLAVEFESRFDNLTEEE